jgi:hypothetical protein
LEVDAEQRKKYEIARAPPARIKDAVGGIFDATSKELKTIYGMLKRVQIVALILDRQYTPASQGSGEKSTKSRLRIMLDDGTGIMAATWFGVGDDEASGYEKGDMVIVLARAGEYKNEITFTIDGIRKLTDLSTELHHRAVILKKLKQLAVANQPLTLQGGGRITNQPDEASKFFTSTKGSEPQDISEIEHPIKVNNSEPEKTQIPSRLGEEAGDGEGGSEAGGGEEEPGEAGTRDAPGEDLDVDDDIIKGSIMDTIMQPEHLEGITIAQLEEAIATDRKVLARVLKIMEHERTVEQVPSKPGTYRAK